MAFNKEKKYRVYLDNCCFNRPYDNQTSLIVHLESEAKLFVQREILNETFELAWSYILDYENYFNPYINRKTSIAAWKEKAVIDVDASAEILEKAKSIATAGIKNKDALHIACAIEAKCHYFLTTDKRILKENFNEIVVLNPLDFIKLLEM